MNFSQALEALKEGKKIKRSFWGGYWAIQVVTGRKDSNFPAWDGHFIVAKLKDNAGYAPAQPYQADLLANDWEIVE